MDPCKRKQDRNDESDRNSQGRKNMKDGCRRARYHDGKSIRLLIIGNRGPPKLQRRKSPGYIQRGQRDQWVKQYDCHDCRAHPTKRRDAKLSERRSIRVRIHSMCNLCRTTKITRLPPSDIDFGKRPIGKSGAAVG